MTHHVGGLSNYYAQLAAQQAAQGIQSAQGSQSTSDTDIQQWLTSLVGSHSSAATQTGSASASTAPCSGAASFSSNVSGQNLLQAQGTDNGSNTTQTASTDPATAPSAPQGHHHHHHGGGMDGTLQTGKSWFTAMDTSGDSGTTTTGGASSTTPASFASLLSSGNTSSSAQSLFDALA